jgi:hypothetical protein
MTIKYPAAATRKKPANWETARHFRPLQGKDYAVETDFSDQRNFLNLFKKMVRVDL